MSISINKAAIPKEAIYNVINYGFFLIFKEILFLFEELTHLLNNYYQTKVLFSRSYAETTAESLKAHLLILLNYS